MNKSLKDKENELKGKVDILQAVAGAVRNTSEDEQIVVVNGARSEHVVDNGHEKELERVRKKIDEVNRRNSLLKDELQEKTDSLASIDSFYKEIIVQKDLTISKFNDIHDADQDTERQFKRLLTKFRTENELKFMQNLKITLEREDKQPTDNTEKRDEDLAQNIQKSSNDRNRNVSPKDGGTGSKEGDSVGVLDVEGKKVINENLEKEEGKKMCRYGTKCNEKGCALSHNRLDKPCRFGRECRKGDGCLFRHFSDVANGGEMRNVDNQKLNGNFERYEHFHSPVNMGNAYAGGMAQFSNAFGGLGHLNSVSHDVPAMNPHNRLNVNVKLCKYGRTCRNMTSGCTFRHEVINKTCKYADRCAKGGACLFLHHNVEVNMGGNNRQSQQSRILRWNWKSFT